MAIEIFIGLLPLMLIYLKLSGKITWGWSDVVGASLLPLLLLFVGGLLYGIAVYGL